MIVESDKTSNSYKISKHEYNKLLLSSIRDNYKKGDGSLVNSINKEAKQIAEELQLESKINQMPKRQCYITLKDHKQDFNTKP